MNNLIFKKELIEEKKNLSSWGSLAWIADKNTLNTTGCSMARVVIKMGLTNPLHTHSNCEEVLYLLSGKLEHKIGDDMVVVEPGDSIVVEAGIPHHALSVGDVDADMIVIYSSATRSFESIK